jgi:hypothetical protein
MPQYIPTQHSNKNVTKNIARAKKTGGVAQVVKNLTHKYKALVQTPPLEK